MEDPNGLRKEIARLESPAPAGASFDSQATFPFVHSDCRKDWRRISWSILP